MQRYPGTGNNWPVSGIDGGEEAVWSRSGDKLYYRSGQTWMSVDVTEPASGDGMAQLSAPQRLFSGSYVNIPGVSYDVTADGDFILLQSLQDPAPNRIRIVTNWLQELRAIATAR
jgi:hypothetical protein